MRLLIALSLALLGACTSFSDTSSDEPKQPALNCVPGQQVECACAQGKGLQICKDDGYGFDACSCSAAGAGGKAGASGKAGAGASAGSAGEGAGGSGRAGAGAGGAGAGGAGQGGAGAGAAGAGASSGQAGASGGGGQGGQGAGGDSGSAGAPAGAGGEASGGAGGGAGDTGSAGDAGSGGSSAGSGGDAGAGGEAAGAGGSIAGSGGDAGSAGDAGAGGGAGDAGAGGGAGDAGAGGAGASAGGAGSDAGGAGQGGAGAGGAGGGSGGGAGATGAVCGNGVLEGDEACDVPGSPPGVCAGCKVYCSGPDYFVNPATGSCYWHNKTLTTWDAAKIACEGLGGGFVLATTSTLDEMVFIDEQLTSQGWVWIGAHKQAGSSSNFYWMNGEPWTFPSGGGGPASQYWEQGEPDGAGQPCVNLGKVSGRLADYPCSETNESLCERVPASCEEIKKTLGKAVGDFLIDADGGAGMPPTKVLCSLP